MAISPIDLQTLFTQADKVGKQVGARQEGAAIAQSLQQTQMQQQIDERVRAIEDTPDQGEGAEGVRERKERREGEEAASGKKQGEAEEDAPEEKKKEDDVFRSPAMGKNIDIML
jgi:hypothetical protein